MFKSFQNLAFGYIEHEARIKELEKGVFNKSGNTNTNIDDKTLLTIKNFMNTYIINQQVDKIGDTPMENIISGSLKKENKTEINNYSNVITDIYTVGDNRAIFKTKRIEDSNIYYQLYIIEYNDADKSWTYTPMTIEENMTDIGDIFIIVEDVDKSLYGVSKNSTSYYTFIYKDGQQIAEFPPLDSPPSNIHGNLIYTYIKRTSALEKAAAATESETNKTKSNYVIVQSDYENGKSNIMINIKDTNIWDNGANKNLGFSINLEPKSDSDRNNNMTYRNINEKNQYITLKENKNIYFDAFEYTGSNDASKNAPLYSFVSAPKDIKIFDNNENAFSIDGKTFDKNTLIIFDGGYIKGSAGTDEILIFHYNIESSTQKYTNMQLCYKTTISDSLMKTIDGASNKTIINNINGSVFSQGLSLADNIAYIRQVDSNQYIPSNINIYSHNSKYFFTADYKPQSTVIDSFNEVIDRAGGDLTECKLTYKEGDTIYKYNCEQKTKTATSSGSDGSTTYHYLEITRNAETQTTDDETYYGFYLCGRFYRVFNPLDNEKSFIVYTKNNACESYYEITATTKQQGSDTVPDTFTIKLTGDSETSYKAGDKIAPEFMPAGIEFIISDPTSDNSEGVFISPSKYIYITPFIINRFKTSEFGKMLAKDGITTNINMMMDVILTTLKQD